MKIDVKLVFESLHVLHDCVDHSLREHELILLLIVREVLYHPVQLFYLDDGRIVVHQHTLKLLFYETVVLIHLSSLVLEQHHVKTVDLEKYFADLDVLEDVLL